MRKKDRRGMEWELFQDASYWDEYCVKPVKDVDFNAVTVRHFLKYKDAVKFFELIIKSS